METHVRTPQVVFTLPQQLLVPLFQRPYVWSRESQWEPLWDDVRLMADRALASPATTQPPHFLGAVVMQQESTATGLLQRRTVIDGQQRLTTLQLLLDALQAEFVAVGATLEAKRLDALVVNAEEYRTRKEDRFKVLPTSRDRPAFFAVMAAPPPVDYDALGAHKGSRLIEAHRFFAEEARAWLRDGEDPPARARALEAVVRDRLQLVVIDLGVDENAQEIFETLNARGTPLSAADLIKSFIFQRISDEGGEVERAYRTHWQEFETGFWETELRTARMKQPRSSVFLTHWLLAQTGEEVLSREVFTRFKRYTHETNAAMAALLGTIHGAAHVYRRFVEDAESQTGSLSRLGLFAYRTSVLGSEVIKPLVLALYDRELPAIPAEQLSKALDAVESWLVRRMLVRATTKSYSTVVAELVQRTRGADRARAGDVVVDYLRRQTATNSYWPDDEELVRELRDLPAYRRIGRGRLRMVLEAVEDRLRGWHGPEKGFGYERVTRGTFAIEHVLPRKWQTHWPLNEGVRDGAERDRLLHTLGNLTLLPKRLNSKVSNGPWAPANGKRDALKKHDVLHLNRTLLEAAGDQWSDDAIRHRTKAIINAIVDIWPVPEGHRTVLTKPRPRRQRRRGLLDLLGAGLIEPGATLWERTRHGRRTATVLADGSVDVAGEVYASLSAAAAAMAGGTRNGWWFFLVDPATRRTIGNVWRDHAASLSLDDAADDEDEDEAGPDDEDEPDESTES